MALKYNIKIEVVWELGVKGILRPQRDEFTWGWKKLHRKQIKYLYSWNIVKVIKPSRIKWAGSVTHMKKWEIHSIFWSENTD